MVVQQEKVEWGSAAHASMVAPPWQFCSPKGAVHVVTDDTELKELGISNGLVTSQRKNKLKELLGRPDSEISELPRHRSGWQLLERIQWLEHVTTEREKER